MHLMSHGHGPDVDFMSWGRDAHAQMQQHGSNRIGRSGLPLALGISLAGGVAQHLKKDKNQAKVY